MTEEVEIKGPHDEHLEHATEHAHNDGLTTKVALLTAVLAVFIALFSNKSAHTELEAIVLKNEAIKLTNETSDSWSYYQAKSTRQSLYEGLSVLATSEEQKKALEAKAQKYSQEKDEIRKDAEKLASQAKAANDESERIMQPHHHLSLAITLLQISFALSSITLITRIRWFLYGSVGLSLAGLLIGGSSLF